MIALALFAAALPSGSPQIRFVAQPPASVAAAEQGVEVFALNGGESVAEAVPPSELRVVTADGATLTIVPVETATAQVAAGGFRSLRYRVAPPAVAASAPAPVPASRETMIASATGRPAAFLDRFEPHEPVYGAFGANADGAKLQYSLAFRPFDSAGLLDGVRVAWTQTMFWAIDQPSGPFRATTYSPEVYYQQGITDRLVAGGGYAHDSNGGGPGASIDVNRLYVAASYALPLGDGWDVTVSPKAWAYVGSGYRDVDRYWGNVSLGAAIGQDDGLKVEARLRNPLGSRRAGELYASYPLHLLGGGLGLYVFGQAYSGHGEALDDYRRRTTAARLGVAFTR
jgi:outer membrane phospholipase A